MNVPIHSHISKLEALRKFCEENEMMIQSDTEARVKIVFFDSGDLKEYICFGSFDARTKQLKTQEWVELY